jgi:hypothetical protein
VLLHDIGKIYELSYERGFSYSSEGQLIGHIAIASRMLHEKLRGLPGFPPKPAPPLSDPRSSATHEESRLKSGSGQDCPPHGRQELQPAGPQKES